MPPTRFAALLGLTCALLVAGAYAQSNYSCTTTDVVTSKAGLLGSKAYTIDPWIVPSTNTTNGSLPPGVCPFASFPSINATCKDTLTFVSRAIPAGLRVHGTYLINDVFVNQKTGEYHCPSTATDVDLRNASTGFGNPAACRGNTITQVQITGTPNLTAPFVANPECSGYRMLDPLQVFVPTAPVNCSTASVIVTPYGKQPGCYKQDKYTVRLATLVRKPKVGTITKYLVFSCPNIAGDQPGLGSSHCNGKMTLTVRVTC